MQIPDEEMKKEDATRLARIRAACLPFLRMLVPHKDLKEAKALVKDKAGAEWQGEFGAERTALDLDAKEHEARCARESDAMTALEQQERNTKPYVKRAAAQDSTGTQGTLFGQWELKDQITIVFCVIALVLVMGAGMVNIHTNIQASGSPVFLENPWLSVMLSLLLPISASVTKFFVDMIETDRYRRLYIRFMFMFTLLTSIIWTGLFAQVYEGPAAGLDLDSLGETNSLASWLTGCQLLLEGLVGASLFLMIGKLQSKYAPGTYARNTESLVVNEIIKARTPDYDASRALRNGTRARLVELEALEKAFVTEMGALYLTLRRRYEDSSPTS